MCLCVGTTIVPMLVFIVGNAFFMFLDLTGKPAFMLKYKIQEDKGVPVRVLMKYIIEHVCVCILCVSTCVCVCVCV